MLSPDAIILCICTVLYGRTSLGFPEPFYYYSTFLSMLFEISSSSILDLMKKTFKFLSDHNLTCKLCPIFSNICWIFSPQRITTSWKCQEEAMVWIQMNYGCMRGYHSVLQRNIVTKHTGPAVRGPEGEVLRPFSLWKLSPLSE